MQMMMVNLRAEAVAEVCRVTRVRGWLRDGDARALAQLEGDGPWIGRARRARTRRRLGPRVVFVWRVAYEDACGRVLESSLVPVAVDIPRLPCPRPSRAWLDALVRALASSVPPLIEAASADWQHSAERTLRCVASMRSTRERAVATSLASLARGAYQPGLFDRRAERQHGGEVASTLEATHDAADRLVAVERLASARPRPPQLLLVIAP
jgi:hypothetical protein